MKEDYNKSKKIRRNYNNISKLEAADQQQLEKLEYLENKVERLWKMVGNVETTNKQEKLYDIDLIYNGAMTTSKTQFSPGRYLSIYTTNLDISSYDLTKTFFKCTIETPNSLSYDEAGYTTFSENWGYESIYDGMLYIKKKQYHNTNYSGNAHLKIWAITVL